MGVTTPKALPQAHGDFYAIGATLSEEDQALLRRVRDFLDVEVTPVITEYWIREEFPHQLLPKLAELHIMGLSYQGYGCPGKSTVLDGMMMMELARVDSSMATFRGVHSGLAMGSIYLFSYVSYLYTVCLQKEIAISGAMICYVSILISRFS